MLSSLANRLYWVGRNLERAESTARLIGVYSDLLLDLPREANVGWETLVRITGSAEQFSQSRHWGTANAVVRYMSADQENANSVYNCVAIARENTRTLRELLPREGFESINDLYHFTQRKLGRQSYVRVRFAVLREVVQRCQQISGLINGTMSRGFAYEFLELGRNVEKADVTTRLLDVAAEVLGVDDSSISDHDALVWISVLRSASGYQMYRQSVRSRVTPVRVLHFLINDLSFPRSVRFCLNEILSSTNVLPRGEAPKAAVEQLVNRMDETSLKQLASTDLHESLDVFQQEINRVHDSIAATWFEPKSV